MHAIYFYKDKQGNQPVLDYMRELARHDSKDSRIKLNKLNDYIELLSQQGTRAGQPYIKHLDAEIWELRPLRDRILFVAWLDGSFVLLHHFVKKTQKTPRREIEKAKRELQDLKERGEMKNSAIGSNWKDVRAELFTKEEILESDLRVAIMTELIEARREKGISQKKLEELSGVSQPVIARMETGKTSPQLDTVLKVLASLGKTLAVVPLEQEKV